LLYGSGNWTIKARDARRITAVEMKYMRKTAGYNWTDYKTDTDIAKTINTIQVLEKTQEYKKKLLQHVSTKTATRLSRVL
jgi:hypothetical protein